MKKYFYFLLIVSVLFAECRTKIVTDYSVVIRPIGNSDFTRMTFYIALKKTNFSRKNPFIDEILTDENSLRNVVSFVDDNRPAKNDSIAGWGALKISVYNRNHIIINYNLSNGDQSKNYLRSLIESLTNKNSDLKLIKDLKEGLSEIN
jgi:hypothetical protein